MDLLMFPSLGIIMHVSWILASDFIHCEVVLKFEIYLCNQFTLNFQCILFYNDRLWRQVLKHYEAYNFIIFAPAREQHFVLVSCVVWIVWSLFSQGKERMSSTFTTSSTTWSLMHVLFWYTCLPTSFPILLTWGEVDHILLIQIVYVKYL